MYKKLNIASTVSAGVAILFTLLVFMGWLQEFVRFVHPDLHRLDADKIYWPIEEASLWLVPILAATSLALSIWSVALRLSGWGIALVVVGTICVIVCAYALLFAYEMGKAW